MGTAMNAVPTTAKPRDPFLDPDNWHPLEMFPFFRRWPCGPIRDVLYTFIWNCLIAFLFMVVGLAFKPQWPTVDDLISTLIVANSIGYVLHAMFMITNRLGIDRWARSLGQAFTAAYYTILSTVGVVVGFAIVALAFDPNALKWIFQPRWLGVMGITSGIISTIIAAIFFARERQARAVAELERERLRAERVEREAALANLRALQAQIEPHFLFNTLANVVSLIDPDPATAKRMLDSFIRFLRASLTATRSEKTTLAAEVELISAFLQVLQVRMGERLRFRIEMAPELAAFELPPMLLQPVVENAIKHGLEPKVEGGEIVVRMGLAGKDALIEIADTGVGFQPTTRGGVGLSNLRDRLKALYGERSALTIGENRPAGAVVTVRLPG
jgi:sensor histidine kinase YesM